MNNHSDQTSALIEMSHAVQKLVSQLDHMAISVSTVNRALSAVDDLGAKLAHRNWMLEALVGHAGGHGGGGPYGGGVRNAVNLLSSSDPNQIAIGKGGGASDHMHPAWEGVGKGIDPFHHNGPDFASNWVFNKLQTLLSNIDDDTKYAPGTADLLAGFHSHLTGGKPMSGSDFDSLLALLSNSTPEVPPGGGEGGDGSGVTGGGGGGSGGSGGGITLPPASDAAALAKALYSSRMSLEQIATLGPSAAEGLAALAGSSESIKPLSLELWKVTKNLDKAPGQVDALAVALDGLGTVINDLDLEKMYQFSKEMGRTASTVDKAYSGAGSKPVKEEPKPRRSRAKTAATDHIDAVPAETPEEIEKGIQWNKISNAKGGKKYRYDEDKGAWVGPRGGAVPPKTAKALQVAWDDLQKARKAAAAKAAPKDVESLVEAATAASPTAVPTYKPDGYLRTLSAYKAGEPTLRERFTGSRQAHLNPDLAARLAELQAQGYSPSIREHSQKDLEDDDRQRLMGYDLIPQQRITRAVEAVAKASLSASYEEGDSYSEGTEPDYSAPAVMPLRHDVHHRDRPDRLPHLASHAGALLTGSGYSVTSPARHPRVYTQQELFAPATYLEDELSEVRRTPYLPQPLSPVATMPTDRWEASAAREAKHTELEEFYKTYHTVPQPSSDRHTQSQVRDAVHAQQAKEFYDSVHTVPQPPADRHRDAAEREARHEDKLKAYYEAHPPVAETPAGDRHSESLARNALHQKTLNYGPGSSPGAPGVTSDGSGAGSGGGTPVASGGTSGPLKAMGGYLKDLFGQGNRKRDEGRLLNEQDKLRNSLIKLQESFKVLGDTVTSFGKKLLLHGSAALEAGSPDAMSTLSGSWKLLYAQLGSTLVEPAMWLSYKIQQAARGFEGLSPRLKEFIGVTVGGMAAIAAATMALKASGVSSVASSLWSKAPAGTAAILGTAAAGLGTGAALGTFHLNREQEAKQHGLAATLRHTPDTEEWLKSDMPYHSLTKKFGTGPEQGTLRQIYADTQMKVPLLEQRASILKDLNSPAGKLIDMDEDWQGVPVEKSRQGRLRESLGRNTADLAKVDQTLQYIQSGKFTVPESKKAKNNQETVGAYQLLMDLQSRTQPSYNSIEDIYKKIQLEALADSPLQQEIRRIQLESLQAMIKSSKHLESMDAKGMFGNVMGR